MDASRRRGREGKHIPRAGQSFAALPSGSGQGGLGLSSKRGRAGAKLRRWATGLGYTIIYLNTTTKTVDG